MLATMYSPRRVLMQHEFFSHDTQKTLLVTFVLVSSGSPSLRMNLLDLSRYGLFLKLCLACYSCPLYANESRFGHLWRLCWYFHCLKRRWWGHLWATNLRSWVAFTCSTLRRTWWLLRWGLIGSFRQYFGSIYILIILGFQLEGLNQQGTTPLCKTPPINTTPQTKPFHSL